MTGQSTTLVVRNGGSGIPSLGEVGDMHQALDSGLEPLQLHKAAKLHDTVNFALVNATLLRLI